MPCTPDCMSLRERADAAYELLETSDYDAGSLYATWRETEDAARAAHERCRT